MIRQPDKTKATSNKRSISLLKYVTNFPLLTPKFLWLSQIWGYMMMSYLKNNPQTDSSLYLRAILLD